MRETLFLLFAGSVWAQDSLSLREAVNTALRENQAIAASAAGVRAAVDRLAEARGGMLPKVNVAETFARGDNPVFVFSSLLTRRTVTRPAWPT